MFAHISRFFLSLRLYSKYLYIYAETAILLRTIFLVSLYLLSACQQTIESEAIWQHASSGSIAAAISDNGNFSIVSAYNQPTGWWDLDKNARLYSWNQAVDTDISADNDPALLVAISKNGSHALTASVTNFVIWNTATGQATGYYQAPAKIRSVALSNSARHVLLGLNDGRSVFISLNTGRRLEFFGHQLHALQQQPPVAGEWIVINSVALSPNGRYALTGGDDHYAILWDTNSGQVIYQWRHNSRVHFVRLTNNGQLAFTASSKAQANIWDLTSGKLLSSLKLGSREWIISAARFSADLKRIATGSPGRDLKLWKVADGSLIKAWKVKRRFNKKASGAVVLDIAFSKDEQFLLTEASSGYAQKWRIAP